MWDANLSGGMSVKRKKITVKGARAEWSTLKPGVSVLVEAN